MQLKRRKLDFERKREATASPNEHGGCVYVFGIFILVCVCEGVENPFYCVAWYDGS